MKKHTNKKLALSATTLRTLIDPSAVRGGKAHSDDPCWTTRTSGGLPCTDEPGTIIKK
jgi:hypothetical protein